MREYGKYHYRFDRRFRYSFYSGINRNINACKCINGGGLGGSVTINDGI
jgi:hypothetical protein